VGKTSTESKKKYNKAAYSRYMITIRKDSYVDEWIKEFMSVKGTSLNWLVNDLLTKYIDDRIYKEMNPDEDRKLKNPQSAKINFP
jgi:hypothetical protein